MGASPLTASAAASIENALAALEVSHGSGASAAGSRPEAPPDADAVTSSVEAALASLEAPSAPVHEALEPEEPGPSFSSLAASAIDSLEAEAGEPVGHEDGSMAEATSGAFDELANAETAATAPRTNTEAEAEPGTSASDTQEERASRLAPRGNAKTLLGGMTAPFLAAEEESNAPPPASPRGSSTDPSALGGATSDLSGAPQWCVAVSQHDTRWMTVAEIRAALASGEIHARCFVKGRSTSHWEHLVDVQELALAVGATEDLLAALPPPARDPTGRGTLPPPRKQHGPAPFSLVAQAKSEVDEVPSSFLTLQSSPAPEPHGSAESDVAPEAEGRPESGPPALAAIAARASTAETAPSSDGPEPKGNGKVVGVLGTIVAVAVAMAMFMYWNRL